MSDTIKGWKCTLRKEKTKRRMKRMEELSSSKLTLDEVDDVIQSEAMWKGFNEIADKMVAALLTFRSWQRPGAVANATLAKYKKRTDIQQQGETVKIIRVADHKTGLFGSAKLVIPPDDLSELHAYVHSERETSNSVP